jgi:hypothetical protein
MTAAEPAAQGCATPVRNPVGAVAAQDLGEIGVGEERTFVVPPGTWSVTIVSQEVGESAVPGIVYFGFGIPNSVVPTDVREPGGATFYTDTPESVPSDENDYPDFTRALAYYGGFTPTSGALTIPNTTPGLDRVRSLGELAPGTWRFTVNDFALECLTTPSCSVDPAAARAGRYDVRVITRPGPIASTGTLDVDVYLATEAFDPASGGSGAVVAAAHPALRRVFDGVARVLSNAGICLGQVTIHDLPAWAKLRYGTLNVDTTGPCDALSQLFTLAEAQRPSVHLFLVDEITATDAEGEFRVVGLDGSIPGPSGVPGTINGGTIVSLEDLDRQVPGADCAGALDVRRCGNDRIAYIVAHEAGHWLGLYHVTERTGTIFDPLSDTPTCACAACAPMLERASCADTEPEGQPANVVGAWCDHEGPRCSGASNLMFWLLDDDRTEAALSPQQGEVMRLNPAVR